MGIQNFRGHREIPERHGIQKKGEILKIQGVGDFRKGMTPRKNRAFEKIGRTFEVLDRMSGPSWTTFPEEIRPYFQMASDQISLGNHTNFRFPIQISTCLSTWSVAQGPLSAVSDAREPYPSRCNKGADIFEEHATARGILEKHEIRKEQDIWKIQGYRGIPEKI